ncbi:MAG: pentapeptide repeat-containing protein [Phormidesmis sp.]
MRSDDVLRLYEEGYRDFKGCNLAGVDLSGQILMGVNFARADLSGANLSRAFLTGVNFVGANLSRANLQFAKLSDSCTKFNRADLRRVDVTHVDWADADLTGTCMSDPVAHRATAAVKR